MLKLRAATVLAAARPADSGGEQRLTIVLSGERGGGEHREAIADVGLIGLTEVGDEVIVNVEALDLALGSGGFDIVHANLTRGLAGDGVPGAHVMKLNYTSLQHAVKPVEGADLQLPIERPVAVLALHGQLGAVAWAFKQRLPQARLGFVQSAGGALPGGHSHTVARLRTEGLLAGHVTAGPSFGGRDGEAITTGGALHHGLRELGWDAAICGPGPGIVGSSSSLGHGGLVALDSAHVALALGCRTLLVARMSSGDGRARHRGISHHTVTVLELLLEPVTVALPEGMPSPVALDVERSARMSRHDWRRAGVDLPAFQASGLPSDTMGRSLPEDPLFFGAALAGGATLAQLAEATRAGAERVGAET
jgi:uncharacterized protein DUF3866